MSEMWDFDYIIYPSPITEALEVSFKKFRGKLEKPRWLSLEYRTKKVYSFKELIEVEGIT